VNKEKREKETTCGMEGSQPWFGGQRINCGLGSSKAKIRQTQIFVELAGVG
jgi:hypothetical protein